MKIEMGESVVYSWLRHVKECQIVQNNWKPSPYWPATKTVVLDDIRKAVETAFAGKYDIFKKNSSLDQILFQTECDAIGCDWNKKYLYGVEVAFHRSGTNYNGRKETVAKIVSKCVRVAMCFYAFFGMDNGDITFATPKIGLSRLKDAETAIKDLQTVMNGLGFHYKFSIIANDAFKDMIIDPVLLASNSVDDTAELFLRSYQLLTLFYSLNNAQPKAKGKGKSTKTSLTPPSVATASYSVYRVGQLANVVLRNMLEAGKASPAEIKDMLTPGYSKKTFGLQYPLLVEQGSSFDAKRYYINPLKINNVVYYLCSQWFETPANNDRPLLEKWIQTH